HGALLRAARRRLRSAARPASGGYGRTVPGRWQPAAPSGDRGAPPRGLRLEQRRPQRGEPRLQIRRHLLGDRLPDEAPQISFEAVALPAVGAEAQMLLCECPLLLVQIAVEERLQHLLALLARIDRKAAHLGGPPRPAVAVSATAGSASSRLRMRRPRCRREITVPTGMSRIWAASL